MPEADTESKNSADVPDKKGDEGCTTDVPTLVQTDQVAAETPADPIEDCKTKNESSHNNTVGEDLHELEDSTVPTATSPSATADLSVSRKKPVTCDGKLFFYPPGGWGNRKRKSPEQLFFRDLLKEHAVAYYSQNDQDADKRAFVQDHIMIHYPNGAYFEDTKGVVTRASEEDIFKVVSQKLRDVYNKIIRKPDSTTKTPKRKRLKQEIPDDSSAGEPQQSAGDETVKGLEDSSSGGSLHALKSQYETYIESLQEQVDRLRATNVTQQEKIDQLQKLLLESQPPSEKIKKPAKTVEVPSDLTSSDNKPDPVMADKET